MQYHSFDLQNMSNEQPINPQHTQSYSLRWNRHNCAITRAFYDLYKDEEYCDVTIATDDDSFHCHKMVLAANSPYFRKLFKKTPCKNPCIILKDISAYHFGKLLTYMYLGEVEVNQNDFYTVMKHAEYLNIRYVFCILFM